jgi:murein DD-endopeptidase MepM/ murein hydrolase activator NlpD
VGYGNPNQFPVFLKAQVDGTVTAEVRKFEDFLTSSAQRIGRSFNQAAEQADQGFDFSKTRKAIDDLEREMGRIGKLQSQRVTDPLGIAGGLTNLKSSPLQRMINEQASSEASLDAQRQRSHTQRMQAIQQEFDASLAAIRARRAAETQAIADIIAKENSLVALEEQRAAAQAKMVAGRTFIQAPSFDPTSTLQSAAAARTHATALNTLALAAEKVAAAETGATATDRAYAAQLRASATAADQEATRLAELAATQGRVAGAVSGLNKDQLNLQSSMRATRFATLQAGQQVQDFFIQIGAGTSPLVAFSQQASQLAFVMSAAGGQAGKLARFMSGGGGTVLFAVLALIPVIGTLVGKLFDQNDAVDKAVEKMRKEAEQAKVNAQAQDQWKASIEGVIDAVRRQHEELDRLLKSEAAAQVQAVANAQANVARLQGELDKATKQFADLGGTDRIGELQKSISTKKLLVGDTKNTTAAHDIGVLQDQLDQLQAAKKRMDDLQTDIAAAQKNVTDSQIVLGRAQGKAMADLAQQATRWADLYSDALKGVVQRNPTLSPFAASMSAAVEKLSAAMQHAASAETPFGSFATDAKKLGNELDLGKIKVDDYIAAMEKLAQRLEAVAQAAQDAKKNTGKLAEFNLPVQGRITSGFGARTPPKEGASSFHQGIDIAVPVGTPVRAPQVGTVESVGYDPKLGKFVIISHGAGTTTRYGHLSTVSVKRGDELQQGQVFAETGATGNVTGPHLHYGVYQGSKAVNPLTGKFPADEFAVAAAGNKAAEQSAAAAERAAQQAANAQERLGNSSDSLAERVARINEQWNEQPKLIDQAAQAHRELEATVKDAVQLQGDYNALIAKLQKEKPPGYEDQVHQLEQSRDALNGVIAAAKAAGPVIDQGLLRPLTEYNKQAQQQRQIDEALLSGDQDRADALRTIFDLENRIGPLTAGQKQDVLDTVAAERKRTAELQRQDQLISRAVRSASTVQDALTGGIEAFLKNPTDIKGILAPFKAVFDDFRQNFARSISEALLGGDLGSNMEQALRAKSDPLGAAGSDLTSAAGDLTSAASSLTQAASSLSGAGGPSPASVAATPTAYLPANGLGGVPTYFSQIFGQIAGNTSTAATSSTNLADIQQHQSDMLKRSALLSSPEQYYNLLGSNIGKSLDKALGSGQLFEKIGGKLGTVLEGVSIGQTAGGFVSLLGGKYQGKGTQIGSALGGGIGMLVGGPLGAFVGGLLGGLVGGLIGPGKKNYKGAVSLGSDQFGNATVGKYSGDDTPTRKQNATKDINSVIDALEGLADQLGVFVDASKGAVSIGVNGDDYRVDPTGRGRTNKDLPGVLNFGSDEQGAIEAAVKNLIEDGVLGPIREGTKKLLLNSRDLQAGITKAMKFEDVFKQLKQYTDPVGAAIDDLDHEFDGLRRIFAEAGASTEEYSQLEQLYAFKRADAIKQATQEVNSTLQQLLKDLTYRGDTGLSLRTRQQRALADLAPFEQQIRAGQQVDQEAFANVVQSLLDIERQMFGSTKPYFDMLSRLTSLTQQAISNTGQQVQVPGVTPLPPSVPVATPSVVYPATGTPGAPGTVQTPAVPPAVAAANDNYTLALQITAAINKQTTDLIAAGIKPDDVTQAIVNAFQRVGSIDGGGGPGGGASMNSLTSAIVAGNTTLERRLLDILEAAKNGNAIAERGLSMAGTNAIRYGSDNWWQQAGAGMYFSAPSF